MLLPEICHPFCSQQVEQFVPSGRRFLGVNLFQGVTVRGHLKNTYSKLQVNSGKEAVAMALRHKIVKGE